MPFNTRPLPINDQPAQEDTLNVLRYSQAIKDMILKSEYSPPTYYGNIRGLGMGKTTLMGILRKALQKEGLATIWFDAWYYNQEELWAAFLHSVLNQVGEDLPFSTKLFYYISLLFHRIHWSVAIRILVNLNLK